MTCHSTVYPEKYAHGFCFAVLCCGYTLTDLPISIRLTSLALWQSNDCPSASKATLMNMDKYITWIHYERLHNHNKAKHNKTVCVFLGIFCMCSVMFRLVHAPSTRDTQQPCASQPHALSMMTSSNEHFFSALLALCAGNSPVPGEFPTQMPVTWSLNVFFDLRPNKRLGKQWWGRWFETPSISLWRHCNGLWDVE